MFYTYVKKKKKAPMQNYYNSFAWVTLFKPLKFE